MEQRIHHNANKTKQTGRQIHPALWDKDGDLQFHSQWMLHFVLEDHSANRKGTEVQLTHNLADTHLQYTIPTFNAVVTYSTTQQPNYQLRPYTEATAYTVYTRVQYSDLPGPTWHTNPAWHQPNHGKRVPQQGGTKPAESTAQGDGTAPANIVNLALQKVRMPLIDAGHCVSDGATHRRTWGTIHRALHHNIDRDQPTWLDQGSVTIGVGGWLNSLNPKKLRRVVGLYILYPVPHGMNGHCPGLLTGDPPCGHPCPHALFQPLPLQPAALPGIHLNTVPGTKGVHLTAGYKSANRVLSSWSLSFNINILVTSSGRHLLGLSTLICPHTFL